MSKTRFKKAAHKALCTFFLGLMLVGNTRGQSISDSLLHAIVSRFENQGFKKERVIKTTNNRTDGLPPDVDAPCLTGKEMLVVAVFAAKPQKPFARMLVVKHYHKRNAFDEHLFQPVTYDEGLNIYYALVNVAFPAEANKLNCSTNLQVFDKAAPQAKVWLLVFSK